MLRRMLARIRWLYWGEVARDVEECEDAAEAAIGVFFGYVFGGLFVYAATDLAGSGLSENAAALGIYLIGFIALILGTIHTGSVWVFATQETEMPNVYYNSEGFDEQR